MSKAHGSDALGAQRARLRGLRRGLDPASRARAEQAIRLQLARLRLARPGLRIGVYLAVRGEVRLDAFIATARARGAQAFAPRITLARRRRMQFLPLDDARPARRGAYGIPAPTAAAGRSLRARELDVVLLPLLGFDADGHRLGMGAGYYDRWLQRRRAPRAWRRPLLIGVGFAIQQLPAIEKRPWDVALDLVVTERGVLRPVRVRAPAHSNGERR